LASKSRLLKPSAPS